MFYQKNLWQRQQGHFSRNSALNAFLYILYIQSLIYRLNHQVSMVVFQSNFWQMTAQISQLGFKIQNGLRCSSQLRETGRWCIPQTAFDYQEVGNTGTYQPFIFISKIWDLYSYLHYKGVKRLMARPKNVCGFLVQWARKGAWFFL